MKCDLIFCLVPNLNRKALPQPLPQRGRGAVRGRYLVLEVTVGTALPKASQALSFSAL